jgi:hypothetical protein
VKTKFGFVTNTPGGQILLPTKSFGFATGKHIRVLLTNFTRDTKYLLPGNHIGIWTPSKPREHKYFTCAGESVRTHVIRRKNEKMTDDESMCDTDYKDDADEHLPEVTASTGKRKTTIDSSPIPSTASKYAKCNMSKTSYQYKLLNNDPTQDQRQQLTYADHLEALDDSAFHHRLAAVVNTSEPESNINAPMLVDTDLTMHPRILQDHLLNTTRGIVEEATATNKSLDLDDLVPERENGRLPKNNPEPTALSEHPLRSLDAKQVTTPTTCSSPSGQLTDVDNADPMSIEREPPIASTGPPEYITTDSIAGYMISKSMTGSSILHRGKCDFTVKLLERKF